MLAACGPTQTPTPSAVETKAALPNPASQFCEANGGTLEIRTSADGAQTGICIFPDNTECEEWAYFRGECQPGVAPAGTSAVPPIGEMSSPIPIALQVLLPEEGSQTTIEQCQVIGTTSPGAVVTVNNEILIAGSDGSFQTTITLQPGVNLIEVVASNASGNEAFAHVTVTYQP